MTRPDRALVDELGRSVAAVRARIGAASARAGRSPDAVTLVGVAKFQPDALVEAAVAVGLIDLAESYAQHLKRRVDALSGLGVRWHFVGPLQRNKAGVVARHAACFHALDRPEIADALGSRRDPSEPLEVFVQVNIADEPSKSGVTVDTVGDVLAAVARHRSLHLAGLMTMPPMTTDPEASRPHFRALRDLGLELGVEGLSMGTTEDFEVAVEEGATAVRVGRQVFGDRDAEVEGP